MPRISADGGDLLYDPSRMSVKRGRKASHSAKPSLRAGITRLLVDHRISLDELGAELLRMDEEDLPRRCARCPEPIPPSRRDRRYCGRACQQAAYRDRIAW